MQRLRELRHNLNKKQKEIAQELNLSVQVYCNYENGLREPSFDTLTKLADYFDVSVDYLLGRTEIPNAYKNIVNTHIKNKSADFISTDLPTAIAERMRSHNLSLEKFKNLTPQQTDDLLNIIEIFLNNLK
jgi:transcriptional regulator with XRE-family HTH domain